MPERPAGERDVADLTRWRRGAGAVLLVAAAAGCSVPSSGSPVVVGPAPTGTNVDDNNPDPGDIPTPDEYQGNPKAMVEAYLKAAVAAAANSDDPAKPAVAQSQFLAGKTLKPGTGPN